MLYKMTMILFIIILLFTGSVDAATLEVGSGQTYTTIQAAINASTAGSIVNVHTGTYVEHVVMNGKTCTSGSPCILRVNPGDTVTIDGSYTSHTINLTGSSHYWTIDGFNIKNSGGEGGSSGAIRIYTANNITIKNNNIYEDNKTIDASSDGITSINSQPLYVYNNTIHTFGDYAMDIEDTTDNFEAHDNVIYDVTIGIKCARNTNCKLYNNWIYGLDGSTYGYGIYLRDTQSSLIYNNVIEDDQFYLGAVYIYSFGAESSQNGKVYNNTIVKTGSTGGNAIVTTGITSTGWEFKNNIVHNFSTALVLDADTTTSTYSYNDWSNCSTGVSDGDSNTNGGGNITTNATFVGSGNKPSPYYNLQSNSGAKDTGTSLSAYFTTDYSGISRPQGVIWDMGAYEYISGICADCKSRKSIKAFNGGFQ